MDSQNIPVLLIIFNRPEKVRRLFDSLSQVKPKKIYVTADGPRADKPEEAKRCAEARSIATDIPWECEIVTNFSDVNQGCKMGVSSGITWFFTHEEEGIILEDDCLPDPSFFLFIGDVLARYRNENQVMHINGTSFLPATSNDSDTDYYFSHISHSWGWATWKRAWEHYDGEMRQLPELKKVLHNKEMFTDKKHINFWQKLFFHIKVTQTDSWANPWQYSILINKGICITPTVNLIQNIGFDSDATHTTHTPKFIQNTQSVRSSKISHPVQFSVNKSSDAKVMNRVYMRRPLQRVISLLQKWYYSYT